MFFVFIGYTAILVFSIGLIGLSIIYVPEVKNKFGKFVLIGPGLVGFTVFFGSFGYLMAGAP